MKHNFAVKTNATIVFKQAAAARRFALAKSRRQFKRQASGKVAYVPGSIGLSMVAAAIEKEYGGIISKANRKGKAKRTGQPRTRFYSHQ
jgi:hypothetical protein